jgi:hypothetical protein
VILTVSCSACIDREFRDKMWRCTSCKLRNNFRTDIFFEKHSCKTGLDCLGAPLCRPCAENRP